MDIKTPSAFAAEEVLKRPCVIVFACIFCGVLCSQAFHSIRIPAFFAGCGMIILCTGLYYRHRKHEELSYSFADRMIFTSVLPLLMALGASLHYVYTWRVLPDLDGGRMREVQLQMISDATAYGEGFRCTARVICSENDNLSVGSQSAVLYVKHRPAGTLPHKYDTISLSHAYFTPVRYLPAPYGTWVKARRSVGTLRSTQCRVYPLKQRGAADIHYRMLHLKEIFVQQLLAWRIPAKEREMLEALVLGRRGGSYEYRDVQQAFNAVGISHLLAVSGFHVGVMVFFVSFLTSILGCGRVLNWLLLIAAAWTFCFFTGNSVPTVRAALVFTLYGLGFIIKRKADKVNTLALAATILLVGNPYIWYDVSFRLSFTAVLSILLFYRPLYNLAGEVRQPLLKYLWSLVCLSCSAQILTLPLICYHFGSVTFMGIIAGVPAVIMASLLIPLTLVVLIISSWNIVGIAPILQEAVMRLTHLMYGMVEGFARVSIAPVMWDARLWQMLLYWVGTIALALLYYYRRSTSSRFL
ncbi:ComEC/Rec2 family competence protein [Porphyromonas pogonae]|uniref:ComEC/Rec2 family competence protein n=1 Tax=Porphyromonas pogonae TaxID=867595 RepID=UPI002E7A89A4|nr:ComEC/Rec2 family competence protein [Porphyromonas pogonae]